MITMPEGFSPGDFVSEENIESVCNHLHSVSEAPAKPALPSAINELPIEVLSESQSTNCAVCMENFSKGDSTKKMPCNHVFHTLCLDGWLAEQKTCPTCRHELPEK